MRKGKATGLRADGTPRRPSYSDGLRRAAPTRAVRSDEPIRPVETSTTPAARRAEASAARGSATIGGSGGARKPKPVAAGPVRKPRQSPAGATIRKPRTTESDGPREITPSDEVERLQKVLATAGIGSRRACEELIAGGRVTINGRIAELGNKVDAVNDEIHVDGERVVTDSRRVYLAINKPAGVLSTMSDEKGREALADYLGNVAQRVYHVGRLDAESEGLLLLTNDGGLAHKLTHPSYEVPKTYLAEVRGPVRNGLKRELTQGIELEDGPARVDSFRLIDSNGGRVLVEVILHEGRKHIVRRLLAEVGYPVLRLIRTSIGPIKLGDLKLGRTRRLTRTEIAALFKVVEDVEDVDE